MRLRNACALALAVVVSAGCQLWIDEYRADREDPVDPAPLCEREHDLIDVELKLDSNEERESLEAYYAAANPKLLAQFNRVIAAASAPTPTRTATYLTGEAGAGKSFIMRTLVNAFPSADICDVVLPQVFAMNSSALPTQRMPDLATRDEAVVLNELPSLRDPDSFSMAAFLELQGCIQSGRTTPLILIDGLDEVHPDSALAVLREVETFLLRDKQTFVHILVLGRPEGFAPWFANPSRGSQTGDAIALMSLETPLYTTRGDIAFRLREYLDFTKQLDGYEASGEFDEYVESLANALERYPFLRYSLSNLAVGNVVMQHTAPGSNADEFELKTKIFEDLLARNVETHGRPGTGSRYDAPYIELFERIAARHTNVNSRGEFTVSPTESLPFTDRRGEPLGEMLVTSVLERSGLAYLASPTSTTKRFRFSPFWVHGYLVERFNQRNTPKYEYVGCD